MTPQASIIIPAYNAETSIEHAVMSVVKQSQASLEIIVVDDGSSDRTSSMVAELAKSEPRLKLTVQPRNRGPGAARNKGLELATGDWVAFLDADDWIAPQRISELISYGQQEDVDIVYDNQYFTVGESSAAWRTLFPLRESPHVRLPASEMVRNDTIGRVGNFGLLKPVIKREFLEMTKVRYPEGLRLGEDFCFHMRCFAAGAMAILVSKPLYYYRTGAPSLSATHDLSPLESMVEEYRNIEKLFHSQGKEDVAFFLKRKIRETDKYIEYKRFLLCLRNMRILHAISGLVRYPSVISILVWRIFSFCATKFRMSAAK